MADRPLSPEEAALWARVLTSVRPLKVAPAPVVRVKAAVVAKPKIIAQPAPVPGKGGAGGGSGAVQMFEKLLATGIGGRPSKSFLSAQTRAPSPSPASGKQRPALFRSSRGDDRPDAPEGEGLRRGNTLDSSWDRQLSRGLVSPDHMIDLHGHNLSTAYATLDGALEQAIGQGDRVILLVTGKPPRAESERPHARGAIRAAIGDWLAGSRHAGSIAAVRNAHPRHGGAGALYIILRKAAPKRLY